MARDGIAGLVLGDCRRLVRAHCLRNGSALVAKLGGRKAPNVQERRWVYFVIGTSGLVGARSVVTRKTTPVSARRARHEARRARALNHPLSIRHPYESLPTWVPYTLAKLIARLLSLFR